MELLKNIFKKYPCNECVESCCNYNKNFIIPHIIKTFASVLIITISVIGFIMFIVKYDMMGDDVKDNCQKCVINFKKDIK